MQKDEGAEERKGEEWRGEEWFRGMEWRIAAECRRVKRVGKEWRMVGTRGVEQ